MIRALALLFAMIGAGSAQPPRCDTLSECQQLTRDAIAARQYERAHDIAWLAYQKGRRDPETLILLARTQSLSGRGDDAFVMLRRLAESGTAVGDVETSADFERVRHHPQYPQLLAAFARITASPAVSNTPSSATTPSAPAASLSPSTMPAASAASAAVTRIGEDLALPEGLTPPATIAYDVVSARFILGAPSTDALTVLSQTSNNAAAFTSRGWSGAAKTTAMAIDRAAGDLWVAVHDNARAAVHRLQLISGRRLEVIDLDAAADIVSMAISRDGLFVLDRTTDRVLRRRPSEKSFETVAALGGDIDPTSLAHSGSALYVAHASGVIRVEPTTGRSRALSLPRDAPVGELHSLAWHDRTLLAIERVAGEHAVVRMPLNAQGTGVTRIERLGPAASHVATLAGGVFYYLAPDAGRGRVLRAIAVK